MNEQETFDHYLERLKNEPELAKHKNLIDDKKKYRIQISKGKIIDWKWKVKSKPQKIFVHEKGHSIWDKEKDGDPYAPRKFKIPFEEIFKHRPKY